MAREAPRCQVLATFRLWFYVIASDVWPESKAPARQAVLGLGFVSSEKLVLVNAQSGKVVRLETGHVDVLVLQRRAAVLRSRFFCILQGAARAPAPAVEWMRPGLAARTRPAFRQRPDDVGAAKNFRTRQDVHLRSLSFSFPTPVEVP